MAPKRYKAVAPVERSPSLPSSTHSRSPQHFPRMVTLWTCMRKFLEPSRASRRGFWTSRRTLLFLSHPPFPCAEVRLWCVEATRMEYT